MTLVDSNVIIDIVDRDPIWYEWSAAALAEAGGDGAHVNSSVIAELSRGYETLAGLQSKLSVLDLGILPLDDVSGFLAGKRFQEFRRSRSSAETARVLPDFLIGAHALTLEVPLLTRDPRLYRRYFPELSLITPETDNG